MMNNLFWYCLFGAALVAASRLFSNRSEKIQTYLRKFSDGKISKLINSYGYLTLSVAWAVFLLLVFNFWMRKDGLERLALSIYLIAIAMAMNDAKGTLLIIAITPIEKTYTALMAAKKSKKLSQYDLKSLLRVRRRNLIAWGLIAISFSMDLVLNEKNHSFFGSLILALGLLYITMMVVDTVLLQRWLIEATGSAEEIERWIVGSKLIAGFVRDSKFAPWINIAISVFKHFQKDLFDKTVDKMKATLARLNFWSRYGVTIIRSYIIVRLVLSFIVVTALMIILEGNYLWSYMRLNGGTGSRMDMLAQSFYLYTGNSLVLKISSDFISFQTFGISLIGWALFVLLLILVIDSFSTAYEPFNAAVARVTEGVRNQLESLLKVVQESAFPTELKSYSPLIRSIAANIKDGTIRNGLDKIASEIEKRNPTIGTPELPK